MEENWEKLKEIIEKTDNIIFFGGAGVSTESGIPDFRSVDGLYNQKYEYPPETILSHTFLPEKPGGIFPVLPGQDALSGCIAQRCPQEAGAVGAGREA